MTPIQEQRALEFVNRIARDIEHVPRQDGYDLVKPDTKPRVGFVRYNVNGQYIVYAYEPRSDPEGRFVNNQANNPLRGWRYTFSQHDENAIKYAVSVLEAGYDMR